MYCARTKAVLLGVCALIGDKSGLPVLLVRILAVILFFKIGFWMMSALYLGLAILLPRP